MGGCKLLTLALVVLFFSSCNDEPANIAEDLFGGNLIGTELYTTSGNELTAKNIPSEAVNFNSMDYLMIGEYNDPKYGSVKADFLSELSLGSIFDDTCAIRYDDTYEYVSTELRLRYKLNSWIGDTLAQQKLSVYELSSRLDAEYDYNSDFDPTGLYDAANPIGELTFEVKDGERDTMWQETGYTHNIAIKIDDEVGLRLFEADSATITNSENFKNLFNGIYLTSTKQDSRKGSILRIPYTSASGLSQELAVIYRVKKTLEDASGNDSTAYDTIPKLFPINKEATKAIRYTRDYTNSGISFTNDNADKLYLQGMGGSRCKVNISDDFVNQWKGILPEPGTNNDQSITSIASVELSFYVDTVNSDFRNTMPQSLNLYVLNESGNYVTPSYDASETSTNVSVFNGGTPKATEDGGIKYTFTMQSGFFEEFIYPTISGNKDKNFKELYLGIPNADFSFDRIILHGMSINPGTQDKTILPSNLSVRYVTVE